MRNLFWTDSTRIECKFFFWLKIVFFCARKQEIFCWFTPMIVNKRILLWCFYANLNSFPFPLDNCRNKQKQQQTSREKLSKKKIDRLASFMRPSSALMMMSREGKRKKKKTVLDLKVIARNLLLSSDRLGWRVELFTKPVVSVYLFRKKKKLVPIK